MAIITPKCTYAAPTKEEKQRGPFYDIFVERALPEILRNENAVLAILPSWEGIEIYKALSLGVPQKQIMVIDNNPEVMSRAPWVKDCPDVIRHTGELRDGLDCVLKPMGKVVSALNADMCGNYSNPFRENTKGVMENTTFTKGAVVSFTMAKCREKAFDFSETKRIASEAPDFKGHIFKEVRVAALIEETDCLRESMSEVLLEDSYRAGGNTGSHMCFVVVAL